MKLQFISVLKRSTPFCVELNSEQAKVSLSGNYYKDGAAIVLEGRLAGSVQVECGVTCQPFFAQIDEELFIKFVEGGFKGFDPKYDVIEINGEIDLDRFLLDEIESFRLDYHIAPDVEFVGANL